MGILKWRIRKGWVWRIVVLSITILRGHGIDKWFVLEDGMFTFVMET
jgi:hypothetical protein